MKIQNLFIVLILLGLPLLVQAQFNFITNSGTISITSYTGTNGTVTIPASTNGYPVTTIWPDAFSSILTSVAIPGSVTNIETYSFSYCSSLTNITVDITNPAYSSLSGVLFDKSQLTLLQFPEGLGGSYIIPNSITSIGEDAFAGSINLTNVTIPDSVTNIARNGFFGTSLTSVTLPGSLISIGEAAFAYSGLTNVSLPDSVASIGYDGFVWCSSLRTVTIGAGLTNIGPAVFFRCVSLTNILVDAFNPAYSGMGGVLFDKVQATLFQFPAGLGGSYTIPNTVTIIGDSAFDSCAGLTNLTIPDNVITIGAGAFENCTSLTNLTIGNGVTSIGAWAFDNCPSLTSLTLPNGVLNIEDYAFDGCYRLTTMSFGNSLTNIGIDSFSGCYNLASVYLPDSVTTIGDGAFGGCERLQSVSVGSGITSIGIGAFSTCFSLASVSIGNGATSIGAGAFTFCVGLQDVHIGNGSTNISSDLFADLNLTSVSIADGVTTIGEGVFLRCTNLSTVTLPSSLNYIGQYAFYGTSLGSVAFPNHVTGIGQYAFAGCKWLASVTLPGGVTSVGDYAFENCSNLTTAYFQGNAPPDNGTAFLHDPATVYYVSGSTGWGQMFGSVPVVLWQPQYYYTINDGGVTITGYGGPAAAVIPATINGLPITGIGNGAFEFNTSLTSVTLPNSITNIGGSAFYGCTSLASLIIPDRVNSIGDYAFANCISLTSAYFQGNAPPDDGTVFLYDPATVYYLPGTTGWSSTFGGVPAVLWNPQANAPGFTGGHFGFDLTGPANAVIVVEASTNLSNPVWLPVATITFAGSGTYSFSDSSSDSPSRYYRFRSP